MGLLDATIANARSDSQLTLKLAALEAAIANL